MPSGASPWPSRLSLALAQAGLEASLLAPWMLAVGALVGGGALLRWAVVAGILALGQICAGATLESQWPLRRVRACLGLTGLAAAALAALASYPEQARLLLSAGGARLLADPGWALQTAPAPVGALVAALVLWWRAIALARARRESEDVLAVLRWGLSALVALLLGVLITGGSLAVRLEASAGPAALGALCFGLGAMGLAAIRSAERRARARGVALDVHRRWLGVVLGAIGTILLLTVALAQALSLDLLASLAAGLRPLGELLLWILYGLLLATGVLVAVLVYVGRWLLSGAHAPAQPFSPMQPEDFSKLVQGPLRTLPPEVVVGLKWGAASLGAVLLLALVLSSVRRYLERDGGDASEERDSVWSREEFLQALRFWLAGLLRRRGAGATAGAGGHRGASASVSPAARSVREAYRRFLVAGLQRGLPRHKTETPAEYGRRAQSAFGAAPEVGALTRLYHLARYGEQSAEEDAAQARACLERLGLAGGATSGRGNH